MVELLREHEVFGLPFEEQYGGTGTGALMVLVAIEELSKVCATTGLLLAVQELGSLGIKLAGTDEQKARWLPRLPSGGGAASRGSRAASGCPPTRSPSRARARTRRRCGAKRSATATSTS